MCVAETFTDKQGKSKKFYNGTSPDEVALVEFASNMRFYCTSSNDHEVRMKSKTNNVKEEE